MKNRKNLFLSISAAVVLMLSVCGCSATDSLAVKLGLAEPVQIEETEVLVPTERAEQIAQAAEFAQGYTDLLPGGIGGIASLGLGTLAVWLRRKNKNTLLGFIQAGAEAAKAMSPEQKQALRAQLIQIASKLGFGSAVDKLLDAHPELKIDTRPQAVADENA